MENLEAFIEHKKKKEALINDRFSADDIYNIRTKLSEVFYDEIQDDEEVLERIKNDDFSIFAYVHDYWSEFILKTDIDKETTEWIITNDDFFFEDYINTEVVEEVCGLLEIEVC